MEVLEPIADNSRELLTELTVEYEALKDDYTLQVIFIIAIKTHINVHGHTSIYVHIYKYMYAFICEYIFVCILTCIVKYICVCIYRVPGSKCWIILLPINSMCWII
jgi:hypothetical protein